MALDTMLYKILKAYECLAKYGGDESKAVYEKEAEDAKEALLNNTAERLAACFRRILEETAYAPPAGTMKELARRIRKIREQGTAMLSLVEDACELLDEDALASIAEKTDALMLEK